MQRISVDVFVHSFVCASLSSDLEICGGICNHYHLNRPSRISAELSWLLGCHTSTSNQLDNSFTWTIFTSYMHAQPTTRELISIIQGKKVIIYMRFASHPYPVFELNHFLHTFLYSFINVFLFDLLFVCCHSVLINIQFWCLLILSN